MGKSAEERRERRRAQLREADRRRNLRDREKRRARCRVYAKAHYDSEAQRVKSAKRRKNGGAAFVDWLRAEWRREARGEARRLAAVQACVDAYNEWFDALDGSGEQPA